MNEEFIIDPLDLIDSVDDMSAIQKTEFRDAARIGFRNRVEFARVTDGTGTAITDATSLSDGDNVIVTIRASGVSGVTRLVLDFDGVSGIVITDATELESLNTGDDISFPISGSLPSGTYTNDTELEILLEGASSEVELIIATLGDLIGDGRTIEDADLVVTPERVKSAIDNTDNTAKEEIRDNLNINFLNLPDTPSALGASDTVLGVNADGELAFVTGGDASSLAAAGFTFTAGTTAGDPNLILSKDSDGTVYGTFIERTADDGTITVDFMVSGQFIAGGG